MSKSSLSWRAGTQLSAQLPGHTKHPSLTQTHGWSLEHTQHCGECPWRRKSAPGWLGAAQPGEFLALSDSGTRLSCHSAVDYEQKDWKAQAAAAPQCAGHAIFLANRCKLPQGDVLRLSADRETVFARPHEFVAHQAGAEVATLETSAALTLYEVCRLTSPACR